MNEDKKDFLLKIAALGLGIVTLLLSGVRQDRAIDKAVQKRLEEKEKPEEEKKE